jgi:hypothetical protein
MGKYEPLAEFLRTQRTNEVSISFADIERIVGAKLPPTAQRHRAWWSNNPSNSVMTKAWLDAGFRSEQVDLAAGRLVFRRAGKPRAEPLPDTSRTESRPSGHSRHPLLGALKGLVRVMSGTDLTKPADPDWGRE